MAKRKTDVIKAKKERCSRIMEIKKPIVWKKNFMRSPEDIEFMRNNSKYENYLQKRRENIEKCFEVKEGNGTFLKWLKTDNKQTK